MKVKLLLVLGTILAVLGFSVSPAAAWQLDPYEELRLQDHGCDESFVYGQFGTKAFAIAQVYNGGCSTDSAVQAWAYGDSSPHCSFANAYLFPGECTIGNNGTAIQATVTGTSVGGEWRLCWFGGCWQAWLELTP